jgi:hypothetical protein
MPINDILSFGNLRVNWANVGSDEDPYQLDYVYTPANDYFVQFSLKGVFPHGDLLAFTGPRIYPPENLKPQNQRSFEIGTNLKFWNNRLGIDFTYYNVSTTDQIVAISVPISTGYFNKKMNIGEVSNKGFELAFNAVPVKVADFSWDFDLNFSKNKQVVEKLVAGKPDFTYNLTSGWSGLQIQAKEGSEFGMYGSKWKREPETGEFIIDPITGLRTVETGQFLGNIYPDWMMGINNTFKYKGFNLGFLIDIRKGGVMYSGTVASLRNAGLVAETVANREGTFIDKGVVLRGGVYVPNDVPVQSMQDFWVNYSKSSNTEGSVFDASYVKLREIRFGYQLPVQWISKVKLQKAEIALEGRNLWIIKDHVPHIDPEANMFGTQSAGEAVEFNSVPSTRSFGVNLRLNF